MNFDNLELNLIKEALNNFIKSIDYTENQDYIDDNKDNYLSAKKLISKISNDINFSNEDLRLIKTCLHEYIFDLDENRYEIETKLKYIEGKICSIKSLKNKIILT